MLIFASTRNVNQKLLQHGTRENPQGIHQRRNRNRLAAAALHTCGHLRKDAAQRLQDQRAALDKTRERLDGRTHRPDRQMPLGGAVLPDGKRVKTKTRTPYGIRVFIVRPANYLR